MSDASHGADPTPGSPEQDPPPPGPTRKPKIGDTMPAPIPTAAPASSDREQQAGPSGASGATGSGQRRWRRRRGGGGGSAPSSGGNGRRPGQGQGGDSQPVEAIVADGPVELDERTLKRRRGRSRKGRPVGRYLMAVHKAPDATHIAVLEGRNLIEYYVSRSSDDIHQIHGNIYLGRVQNVLPGMEAAFVDIGTPKNAVLYRGDVQYDADDVEGGKAKVQPKIEDMLKARQTIICQVTKNPIAHKGARLTTEVSLPGRFVVLVPNSDTYGISKRLGDNERKRLRQILDRVRPEGHGLIVRTAAENVTAEEIERDVIALSEQWAQIEQLATRSAAPTLLYREPVMSVRVIREEFNKEYRGIVLDDEALFDEVSDYVTVITPALAERVEFYDTAVEPLSMFERHHIHEQLHKALDRKVWLPSGGSLIIEHTEALTVIDVNTGKNVGRSSLEETVFANNLEAAEEIAHQLRLRDIGGIIVIDFVDMEDRKNRDEVVRVFRDALSRDKTRTQVFDISELGLVEMTRKRIGEGLLESLSSRCPHCDGRGVVPIEVSDLG
jgi:ribonuclease E